MVWLKSEGTSRDLCDVSWFVQSISSVGLIYKQERLSGSSKQSGDNGKGKESQGDEGRREEIDLLKVSFI